jgi:hypothetical protein
MELLRRLVARIKAAIGFYRRYASADQLNNNFRYRDLRSGIAGDLRRRFPDA